MKSFFMCFKSISSSCLASILMNAIFLCCNFGHAIPDAKRLYDDLMSQYNRIVPPRNESNATVSVYISLKLTQIIDLNLKNQILTANVWMLQEWTDPKLAWDPSEYGGVTELYVPADQIWIPDLVLYNNADGFPAVAIMTKATILYNGTVIWNPPAIFKTSCNIEISNFPFDTQSCQWIMGSWTYNDKNLQVQFSDVKNGSVNISSGIDLSEYYLNVEWDVMNVFGQAKGIYFSNESYTRLYFNLVVRRKTLFYTVNLIIPCVAIACLSILVFYLPSDSGEKVSLSISILLSLTFFLLVLLEIIPTTSLSMPLIGRYLCFTMILVTLSCVVTIAILNVHFRSPSTHTMSPWVRKLFIHTLPKFLLMKSPQYRLENRDDGCNSDANGLKVPKRCKKSLKLSEKSSHKACPPPTPPTPAPPPPPPLSSMTRESNSNRYGETISINELDSSPGASERGLSNCFNGLMANYPREIEKAIINTMFIAQHIDNVDEFDSIKEDWKYVAMVLDRIFLWFFTVACIVGTVGIFLQAPTIYDNTQPIDIQRSMIAKRYARNYPDLAEIMA